MKRSVAFAGLVLCLTGCVRIGFVGDSITDQARQQLQETAGRANFVSDIYANPGYTIRQIDDEVVLDLQQHPDTYAEVINAGTNDAAGEVSTWQADYNRLLGHATTPCVVLTTINTLVDYGHPGAVQASDINSYLFGQVVNHANYRLVDWNGEVQSGDPVLQPDAVHPNDRGKQWIADHDVAAVQNCGT